MTATPVTMWLDSDGKPHKTENEAKQASAYLAVYAAFDKPAEMGQLAVEQVVSMLYTNRVLVRAYIEAVEAMMKDVMG